MGRVLENLSPNSVFNFFEDLSNIPRSSGNEKAVSDYCVAFAKDRGLECYQDEVNNVIIKKPATAGYENAPVVIIQGHLDMVCEKNMDTIHDFDKDPLKLRIDGDYVLAEGTTLGGDNGIAVAYALALLNSKDIPHPPLEVLFTVDEEVGMKGASALDASKLTGKILLNLDSDIEGELLVSCAGGLKASIVLPIKYSEMDGEAYRVSIKGLKGGHSGAEIDKCRANSNKLLGRLLFELNKNNYIGISKVSGGLKDNAIPREAYADIIIDSNDVQEFQTIVQDMNNTFKNEYKTSDSQINVTFEKIEKENNIVYNNVTKEKLLFMLMMVPNGIQTMSADIPGLVESSLNLGVLTSNDENITMTFAVRSSVKSLKLLIRDQLEYLAELMGAEYVQTGEYPEWAYKKDSPLRDLFVETYKETFNSEPQIKAIHAGLECGIFSEKIPGVDMISFGPNMYDIHTPDERLSISSTQNIWNYLLRALEKFNKYPNV